MTMKYAYQRAGGPIITWRNGYMPSQSRAGETRSLGSLSGTSLDGHTLARPTLLPAPGAPEPIGVTRPDPGLGDCSCKGSCGCGGGLSGIADAVPGGYLTLGIVGFLAWKLLLKR